MLSDQIFENCTHANEKGFENSKLIKTDELNEYYEKFDFFAQDPVLTGPIIANYAKDGVRTAYMVPPCHSLVIGGTGSGKTQCYYHTQAEAIAAANVDSVFFMDLKGELYRTHADTFRKKGYKVLVLNFKQPFLSSRYNPLDIAWKAYRNFAEARDLIEKSDKTERTFKDKVYSSHAKWKNAVQQYKIEQYEKCENTLRRIAATLVSIESNKDPSWEHGARSMVFLLLLGMLEDSDHPDRNMTREKFTIANLCRVAFCTDDDCEILYDWIKLHDPMSKVHELDKFYTPRAKITRDGYISTLAVKLEKWQNVSTEWLTSASDIDVEDIIDKLDEEKYAIFCIIDETRPEGYDLCMTFIDSIISGIKMRTDKKGVIRNNFHILADEFANMPPLPNVENRISTLRSYKVWLHMGIQTLDQLDKVYTETVRKIIINNCDCQFFFGTNDARTAAEFAQSLGQRGRSTTSYNVTADGSLTLSVFTQNAPVVRCSDMAELKLGEAYVKIFRKPSVFTVMEPHFKCPDLHHGNAVLPEVVHDLGKLEKCCYDIRKIDYHKDDDDDDFFKRFRK